MKPTILRFDVPFVPKAILNKALWYLQHRDTHLVIASDPRDKNKFFYTSSSTVKGHIPKVRAEHG